MNDYEAILQLQNIDIKLMRLNRALKSMPQTKKLAAVEQAKKKINLELKKILGQRKDAETEVQDDIDMHDHLTAKADEIRAKAAAGDEGFRRVADIEAQLTSIAKRLEKIEFGHGEKVEAAEKLRRAEKNAHDLIAKLDEEKAQLEDAYKKESADLMAEVRKLAAERREAQGSISAELMAEYDQKQKRFSGLAVEKLVGNVPSVCRVKLQPSQFNDLKKAGSITECPYCHRILVTEEVAE